METIPAILLVVVFSVRVSSSDLNYNFGFNNYPQSNGYSFGYDIPVYENGVEARTSVRQQQGGGYANHFGYHPQANSRFAYATQIDYPAPPPVEEKVYYVPYYPVAKIETVDDGFGVEDPEVSPPGEGYSLEQIQAGVQPINYGYGQGQSAVIQPVISGQTPDSGVPNQKAVDYSGKPVNVPPPPTEIIKNQRS